MHSSWITYLGWSQRHERPDAACSCRCYSGNTLCGRSTPPHLVAPLCTHASYKSDRCRCRPDPEETPSARWSETQHHLWNYGERDTTNFAVTILFWNTTLRLDIKINGMLKYFAILLALISCFKWKIRAKPARKPLSPWSKRSQI